MDYFVFSHLGNLFSSYTMLGLLFVKIPVSITSITLCLIIAIVLEWIILRCRFNIENDKKISIPFICIVIVAVRFIMESAIFHYKDNPLEK